MQFETIIDITRTRSWILSMFRLLVLGKFFLTEMLGRSVTISLRRQSLIIQLSLGGKLVVVGVGA